MPQLHRHHQTREHHTGSLPTPPGWMAKAACNPRPGEDPEISQARARLFDAELEQSPATQTALQYCNSCQVRATCLQDALNRRDEWTILGGTLPSERRAMLRRARTAATTTKEIAA